MSSAQRGPVVVIGSINMDLVVRSPRMPAPGETILGSDFVAVPGGKGANQAVAVGRLGGEVHMLGRVGDDDFGRTLLTSLQEAGVQTDYVWPTSGVPSGCAAITVDDQGENAIVVVPGANHRLRPADIDAAADLLQSAAMVLFQLEIPLDTVAYAVERCRDWGVPTLLDPAPAPAAGLPPTLYQVDILSPNESEAQLLLAAQGHEAPDAPAIGAALLAAGPQQVVLKLGATGSMWITSAEPGLTVSGFSARVVDTTAAGDAFTGALALALAEGEAMPTALRFANAAGALCCETLGAQPAMPVREAVSGRLDKAT